MNQTPKDPRIRALASEAAKRIKVLTVAHESQIEAIYRDFQHKAAQIQEGNADSLDGSSVTSAQSTVSRQEQ